ncbi:uncharacterized protein LOC131930423 [Physella acuta]|uniref:uncharacterized protein LOC131930423 n=1 Tax=Physella acuta TaxID=109671 RepID=UPI0027DE07E3|nr:uncharacterized protein LOC131930423 [Physella acuta]
MGNLLVDIFLSAHSDSTATVHAKNSMHLETFNFILRKARMINVHACKGPCIVMSQDLLKLYMVVTKPGAGNSYCLLTPVELFSTSYSIDTPTSEGLRHFVILTVRHQQRLHININGQQAARKIPKWEYAECEQVFLLGLVEIPDGNHYLDGSGFVNFGCYVYGSSEEQSLYFSNPLIKLAHRDTIDTPIVGNAEEQRHCRDKKYFSECEDRFFGHRCSHYCGCAEEHCTADGNCMDNAACVDDRLFGSRCLFFDIMSTSVLKDVIPDLRDAPATKCSEVSSILIEFRTMIYFDFLYIKLSSAVDEKLPFEIAFSNETDRLSPCSVPRLVKLSETEIRVTCNSKRFANQIFVNFNALTVCVHSIKCSSGIDVAVGESTELYINSVQNTNKKSMIMLPIIQNKTKHSACLHEFYPGKSLSWILKFKVPKRVNYIWMALGQMTVDENNPIVVEIYNKSDQLLHSKSLTFGRSSYEIEYTRTHLVSKIKLFAENGDLTLCDFMAIGDCEADKTGLYCDLPCTCIDECFIDGSCYTATGNLSNLEKSISDTNTGRSGMWWKIAITMLFSIIALSALVVVAVQMCKKNKKPPKKIKYI